MPRTLKLTPQPKKLRFIPLHTHTPENSFSLSSFAPFLSSSPSSCLHPNKAAAMAQQIHNASPFLEIYCKSSGKIRRFCKGTEAQFALNLINQKLVGDGLLPLATYIEAVKDGEESVSFGPTCILYDYGNGWKLQTATNDASGKKKDVSEKFPAVKRLKKGTIEQFPSCEETSYEQDTGLEPTWDKSPPTHEASGKKKDDQPMSEQFPADKGLEKGNDVELTMEQFQSCQETSFEQDIGLEPTWEKSPTHEAIENENDVEHVMEQFSTNEAYEQENEVEPVMEQFPTEDFDRENSVEPTLEPFPMDEGFEKEDDLEPRLDKIPTDEELGNGVSLDSTLEKFPDVIVSPLPNPEPSSMIHETYASDGEDKNGGDGIDMTDVFTTTEVFPGKDELVDWCKKIGMSIGVMIVIGKSDLSNSKRRPRVILSCARSGVYKKSKPTEANSNKRTRVREVGSKKCNCPFKLKGSERDEFEGGGWELKVECGTHNHSLKENLIGHPYIERLTPEEEAVVSDLSDAGVKPQEMLNILKKMNPNNLSTKYTIYNYRARSRLSKLHCRSNRRVDGDDG